MRHRFGIFAVMILSLAGCAGYQSPSRDTWPNYLRGASFMDMTPQAQIAKRPVYMGAGGTPVSRPDAASEYGADNAYVLNYMSRLEYTLYDNLRKPGISVTRAGTDVVVILVRDAILEMNVPDISATGADTLSIISKILKKQYPSTYIEIAGYTDSMRDTNAARALSLDMAQRTAVYLAQHGINPARMFIVGRGASRPIAAQDDIGRLTNRRVEIHIVPVR